jgi:hypothetical protein
MKAVFSLMYLAALGFMLFGYDQGVMSGLFSAGQFAANFPILAEVLPYAPADPHSSPSNPTFSSNIQGAVTAASSALSACLLRPTG